MDGEPIADEFDDRIRVDDESEEDEGDDHGIPPTQPSVTAPGTPQPPATPSQ